MSFIMHTNQIVTPYSIPLYKKGGLQSHSYVRGKWGTHISWIYNEQLEIHELEASYLCKYNLGIELLWLDGRKSLEQQNEWTTLL